MKEAIVLTCDISTDDFTRAGEASSDVERELKQMGVSPDTIRKVAIAMYEGEISMVIHTRGDVIIVEIMTKKIKVILADVGPGIPDVKLTMQAGYSTTPDETCSLSSGVGMGLSSTEGYSDSMDINIRTGEGTTITMAMSP